MRNLKPEDNFRRYLGYSTDSAYSSFKNLFNL